MATRFRFEVDCSICEAVDYASNLREALALGRTHAGRRHSVLDGEVTVFDRMAHYNAPLVYGQDGQVLVRR